MLFVISHRPFVIGQTTIIKGKADSNYLSSANTIYAYTYNDYISYKEKELANCKFDEKGNFNLSFPNAKTNYVFLAIDNAKAEIVCEPGKTYEVNFLAKDSDAVNTLSGTVSAELEFLNSGPQELNFLLADFTMRYEQMLEDYQASIAKKESAVFKKIDTLETLFRKKYAAFNNAYLNNHIEYTFALLDENTSLKGKGKIFETRLDKKMVQLENYDYMAFIQRFYSETSRNLINDPKSQAEINKRSFSALNKYAREYAFTANDTLREAVILKSLAESSKNPSIQPSSVLINLEQALKECKSEANRRSAENIKKKLSVMNIGKPAPAALFQDINGKAVSLANFKGKYIYLNFWASWCSSCSQDMSLIPELKKLYGSKITFISISVDKNADAMKSFLKKNPKLGWVFLYCDDYKKAKEDFNVLTVPAYYLIDPKGNVLKSPAPSPSDRKPDEEISQLENIFIKIKKKQP